MYMYVLFFVNIFSPSCVALTELFERTVSCHSEGLVSEEPVLLRGV